MIVRKGFPSFDMTTPHPLWAFWEHFRTANTHYICMRVTQ